MKHVMQRLLAFCLVLLLVIQPTNALRAEEAAIPAVPGTWYQMKDYTDAQVFTLDVSTRSAVEIHMDTENESTEWSTYARGQDQTRSSSATTFHVSIEDLPINGDMIPVVSGSEYAIRDYTDDQVFVLTVGENQILECYAYDGYTSGDEETHLDIFSAPDCSIGSYVTCADFTYKEDYYDYDRSEWVYYCETKTFLEPGVYYMKTRGSASYAPGGSDPYSRFLSNVKIRMTVRDTEATFNKNLWNNVKNAYRTRANAFKRADSADMVPEVPTKVELVGSDYPIYVWIDDTDDTLFWWTDAAHAFLPEDSSSFFSDLSTIAEIDVTGLNTSRVTNMSSLFYGCRGLDTLDLRSFDTSNVTNMQNMFNYCNGLTSLDLSSFDTSNVTNMDGMFSSCSKLSSLDLSPFDTSKVTGMINMFYDCRSLTSLDVTMLNTSNVRRMSYMFASCTKLTELDLHTLDTSNVTDMSYMFYFCEALTSLDLTSFQTSNVTDMRGMFAQCYALTSVDLSTFDTARVTSMESMFSSCKALPSLDVSMFNTARVTNMGSMFSHCESLTALDLSSFDTARVTSMNEMFFYCGKLTSINLSSFETTRVTSIRQMFYNCSSLPTLDLSNFDLSGTTGKPNLLYGCSYLDILITPAAIGDQEIALPYTYFDDAHTGYATLTSGTPTATKIQRDFTCSFEKPQYEVSTENYVTIKLNHADETSRWDDHVVSMTVDKPDIVTLPSYPGHSTGYDSYGIKATQYGNVTLTATIERPSGLRYTTSCVIQTLYYDVDDSSMYWFNPVYWAADKEITKGYGNVYFGPEQNCTREQMITFLWREMGKPTPTITKNPFSDVKSSAYYYKPVLWAYENGITKGYTSGPDKGKFGVGRQITREDTVTFLYRAAGSPAVSNADLNNSKYKFRDVAKGKYYQKPIVWAAKNSIAKGYADGSFGVGRNVLRKDIVTFLYRYDKKFGK